MGAQRAFALFRLAEFATRKQTRPDSLIERKTHQRDDTSTRAPAYRLGPVSVNLDIPFVEMTAVEVMLSDLHTDLTAVASRSTTNCIAWRLRCT